MQTLRDVLRILTPSSEDMTQEEYEAFLNRPVRFYTSSGCKGFELGTTPYPVDCGHRPRLCVDIEPAED